MALTQLIETFAVPLDGRPSALVSAFNTFFTGKAVFIQSVDFSRLQSPYGSDEFRLRVAYVEASGDGVGWPYEAIVYETDLGNATPETAQEKYDDAFQAGLCKTPAFYVDITDHEQNRNTPDILLVIQVDTPLSNFSPVLIAEPTAPIAVSASGLATLYDAKGDIVGVGATVFNVDTINVWPQDQRGFVAWDPEAGELIGLPTNCGTTALVVAASTTSSTIACIVREP